VRTDDPTTLALVELDEGGSATYRFYVDGTAAPGLTPDDALAALPRGVGYLHVGTLGLVLEPVATALEAVVSELRGQALVMLDPNCRPAAIAEPAAYRERLARVLAHTDVVKVSDEDLAWLGTSARALLDAGPRAVLLTRGGDGAVAITAEGETAVPAPPVDVVDTIGAGDAFSGGWLAWWSERGADLAEPAEIAAATRFACLVAARTCARAGASPPDRAALRGQSP
jgi:fructokinase